MHGVQPLRAQPPAGIPLVADLQCEVGRETAALRADLKAAGVDRPMLFSKAANVERLRFHDLRATFVTWARRAGRGRGWISDRTGHLSDQMMRRYDRGARMLTDLQYEPFPCLNKAIPELAEDVDHIVRIADYRRQ